jgi:hypothetical protein
MRSGRPANAGSKNAATLPVSSNVKCLFALMQDARELERFYVTF